MTDSSQSPTKLDRQELEQWFIARLAHSLNVDVDQLDLDEPFLRYGLDSVESVYILADLEGWLGFEVGKPILEFPDAGSFLSFVSEEITRRGEDA
jgi:acyl carrier protein